MRKRPARGGAGGRKRGLKGRACRVGARVEGRRALGWGLCWACGYFSKSCGGAGNVAEWIVRERGTGNRERGVEKLKG